MPRPTYAFDRRNFLRVGASGVVGALLPFPRRVVMAGDGETEPGFGKAKSVLIVLLSGGPSQLDTLDPKPHAPSEVRGEFSTIGTTIPGVAVCEHLPKLAQQTDRWSIVRSLAHTEHNHLLATHVALTGRPTPLPRGGTDLDRVESRSDFPNFAAALGFLRPRNDGVPSGVSLPNYLIEGPLTWPGQHAGFLGSRYDPWQIKGDPNDADFSMDSLSLQNDMTMSHFGSRRDLLNALNSGAASLPGSRDAAEYREQQELACTVLTSGRMTDAFALNKETDTVRDRYGRNKFGQSLLLSRRLIEAGVPVVQATMGIVQTWDTHVDNWGRLKTTLLPQLDQGLAALMDDLATTGLLDQTLVIVMGEFGRTPKITTLPGATIPGRDHWAHAYSGLFAGAGVLGGQVVGETDAIAAYPVSKAYSPGDICTTLFSALGIRHDAILKDPLNRPHHLLNGNVMTPLYTGRTS